jgi:hypothetical protein
MVYFQPLIPNLGKFCGALKYKMFDYFMAIWNTYIAAIKNIFMVILVIW